MKKISIIIPCYNEAQTIDELLRRVETVSLNGWEKEIIVVDDGSTDGTADILGSYENRMRVIFQHQNQGKGSAVRKGLDAATGSHVIIQDADLEYDPNEISLLVDVLDRRQGDVIFGSRNLHHEKRKGFLIPRIGVWSITKLLNTLYGTKLTDAWTCYKLFPLDVARDFQAGGFEAELLFTARLARRGLKIAEVAISHNPRSVSGGKKIRYRDGIRAIQTLLADWLLHIRVPTAYGAKNVSHLLCCPFCKVQFYSDALIDAFRLEPKIMTAGFSPLIEIATPSKPYVCQEHGSFAIDRAGRPLLVAEGVLAWNTEEHGSGVNWIKSFLKQFPKLYYGIWYFFCPVLMVRNGPKKILKLVPHDAILLDVGSGPERLGEQFINVDVFPFPEVDVVADAAHLPFRSGTIDGVVSESLLEHVVDPQAVADEMVRVLKLGGLLYASAPFVHPYHASPDDFNRWTTSGLKKLFADLEIIETGVRSGPWSAFLMFLAYWLGIIFSFGSRKTAPILAHVFMLVLGPLKYFDLIFMSFPGAETVAAHLYIIGKKKGITLNDTLVDAEEV